MTQYPPRSLNGLHRVALWAFQEPVWEVVPRRSVRIRLDGRARGLSGALDGEPGEEQDRVR